MGGPKFPPIVLAAQRVLVVFCIDDDGPGRGPKDHVRFHPWDERGGVTLVEIPLNVGGIHGVDALLVCVELPHELLEERRHDRVFATEISELAAAPPFLKHQILLDEGAHVH